MLLLAAENNSHAMLITCVAAISLGTLLVVAARRLNLPAIVLLLVGGVLLGPEVLGVVQPKSLGDGLLVLVEMAVGLILFEGGLTLERDGYRSAPAMIKRLLTVGAVATWLGTALAIQLVLGLGWEQAIIAASLVIVTGPTVVTPILKRIRVAARLHSILHWEAVLIDPIGVFIAVLCFEWLGEDSGASAFVNLGVRATAGLGLGLIGGFLISIAVRKRLVPTDVINVFALACAVLIFGVAETVIPKAGLLAVTVAGFVFGLSSSSVLRQIRTFKAEITDLLIGTLFILLTAQLQFAQFSDFGLGGVITVLVVMLLIRPFSVLLCSFGLGLERREKIFLSWIAPRGIVAASMASLFKISLENRQVENAVFVETFTYSVIVATIVLQGLTAAPLARLLGLQQKRPEGWVIIGAHEFGRRIARFIQETAGQLVLLIDTNGRAVREARRDGLNAINTDARESELLDRYGVTGIGHVLALTDNEDLNARLCENWAGVVGSDRVYRCNTSAAISDEESEGRVLWPNMPRPALLASEITRGEAQVLIEPAHDVPAGVIPLIRYNGQRIELDPPDPGPDEQIEGSTMCIRRQADHLIRAVRPDLAVLEPELTFEDLIEKLVDRVVSVYPKVARDQTIAELMERETAFPSVIGEGVAVPHAYSRRLDQRICAIASIGKGVRFPGGGDPVRLVFLVLSPQGDPEGHLATLAEIARLVGSPPALKRLLNAKTGMEIMHLVRRGGRPAGG